MNIIAFCRLYLWLCSSSLVLNISTSEAQQSQLEQEILQEQKKVAAFSQQNQTLAKKIAKIRQDILDVTQLIQEHEQQITTIEQKLSDLKTEEQNNVVIQSSNHQALGRVLISLHHLSRASPLLLALTRQNPHQMVQSNLLLRAAVPHLKTIVGTLRSELDSLKMVRQSIVDEKMMLGQTAISLTMKHETLQNLLQNQSDLQKSNGVHQQKLEKHIARLAREAKSMKMLIAELEAEGAVGVYKKLRRSRDMASIIPKSKIPTNKYRQFALAAPVNGKIFARFGQKTEKNDQGLGTLYITKPQAQIISPAPGQCVFAGPFRSYQHIIIIDHGRGYHTLFAGMEKIMINVGQDLVVGEPIGMMAQDTNDDKPKLYMELRKDGEPINPQPWFAKN